MIDHKKTKTVVLNKRNYLFPLLFQSEIYFLTFAVLKLI